MNSSNLGKVRDAISVKKGKRRRKRGTHKKGEKLTLTRSKDGKKFEYRSYKTKPAGCSSVRIICISCQKEKIDKRHKGYDLKLCSHCLPKNLEEV